MNKLRRFCGCEVIFLLSTLRLKVSPLKFRGFRRGVEVKWFFSKSQWNQRIITLCNANSWHFNSHFEWYFFLRLSLLFIRHTPCFTQLPLCPFRIPFIILLFYLPRRLFPFESQPNTPKIYFIFLLFDYLNYSWNNCAKYPWPREDFFLVSRGPVSRHCQWTKNGFYSRPPRWQHEKVQKIHSKVST
jgi:hypothetical protein